MRVFTWFRRVILSAVLLYTIAYYYQCPDETSLLCRVSNDYIINPIHHYKSNIAVPDSVSGYFKPYNENYVQPYYTFASDKISKFMEDHEEEFKKSSKILEKKIIKLLELSYSFIKNTVFPFTERLCGILKLKLKQLKISLYLNYNIYVKPQLLKQVKKLLNSTFGQKIASALENVYVQKVVSFIDFFLVQFMKSIEIVYNHLYDVYVHSNDNELIILSKKKAEYMKNYFFLKYSDNQSISVMSTTSQTTTSSSSSLFTSSTTSIGTTTTTDSDAISTSKKYDSLLNKIIESANNDFDGQIEELNEKSKEEILSWFRPELQSFSRDNVNSGFETVQKLLSNIEIADKTNENYVSRELFRNELAKKKKIIEDSIDMFESKIQKASDEYVDKVLNIRISIIDTLEEFADSSLNAYSSEIISNGDDWEEWKNFKYLKASLLKLRDSLIERDVNRDFNKFLNSLKKDVYLLNNEAGSYMAILRAKANLKFQTREANEREAQKKLEEQKRLEEQQKKEEIEMMDEDEDEDEEPVTIRSTITRTKTETLSSVHSSFLTVSESSLDSDEIILEVTLDVSNISTTQ